MAAAIPSRLREQLRRSRRRAQDGVPYVEIVNTATHSALLTHGSPFAVEDTATSLRACARTKDLYRGIRIHADLLKRGLLEKSRYVVDTLVNMYAKCGALATAKKLLDGLRVRNVFCWTVLISGYVHRGQGYDALNCFARMQDEGVVPDKVAFACILKACGSVGAADVGEQVHNEIARQGLLGKDVVLGNALVDMYAKCGALVRAQQVLWELPACDVVAWNTLIAGYVQQGKGQDAVTCFEHMQLEGFSPDAVTFSCILKACGSLGAADKGEQIHEEIARQGLLKNNVLLGNSLVDMYAKCGALAKAEEVLRELPVRNVVSWSAVIAGYAQKGQGQDALNCFERMQREGFSPDGVTFACILKACGIIGAADKGEQIHDEIARQGLLGNSIVLGNTLVDMYAKCGALTKAERVLMELPCRDVVSWNALIAGYVQQGQGQDALYCFERMEDEGLTPDVVTFICILKACSSIGAAEKGGQVHDEIARQGLLGNNIVLGNALVDMYAKCGALAKAEGVLEELPARNVVSWSALIAGYAQHGQCQNALNCFEWMQQEGLSPSAITFSCMLNAWTHSGLVDKGHMYFAEMGTNYGSRPNLEHYTCMVDLFGRAGHLDKAVALIHKVPLCDYGTAWSALLNACQKWGDVNIGRWAFEHAIQVDDMV